MGLGKKASALFDGLRRHRKDGRSSRRSKEPEVKSTGGRKEEAQGVPQSEPRRLRLRSGRAGAVVSSGQIETMAQTAPSSQQNYEKPSHRANQYPAMAVPRPIQLLEDDGDHLEEQTDDGYEDEEDEDDIDDSVAEDMKKLEESFKGISQQYRLINRIGEGDTELVVARLNQD